MGDAPRRRRDGTLGVVGAVALGAMTATVLAAPAMADDPRYPSWGDVQRAKADRTAAETESARITALLGGLQDKADAAGRTAAVAAERFHRAKIAEDAARERHAALAAHADAAAATARTSRMRAGLLAASVARGGSTDLQLMLDAGGADDFLHRLATVSQLSAQSQAITQQALVDENQATALGKQADAAAEALSRSARAAKDALDEARRADAIAAHAVGAEQQHADRLVAQLADLRGTSKRLAAQYAAGVHAAQMQRAAVPPAGTGPTIPAGSAPRSAAPGAGAPDPASAAAPPAPASPTQPEAPAQQAPQPAPDPVAPAPAAPAPGTAGEPNSAQAASAVAFARDQIGDPYRFAAAGPNAWDCSGLTMQAYATVGIGIGGHSATAQYSLAKSQGKLVPYTQVRVGDLVFYTDGGGDMYHVAIYSGGGMMIEAPYPGVPVREVPVRSADRVPQVARPTASAS